MSLLNKLLLFSEKMSIMFIMVISKKFNEGLSYDLKRKCHDFVLDSEIFKKTYMHGTYKLFFKNLTYDYQMLKM